MMGQSPAWVTQKEKNSVTYSETELKAEMGRRLKGLRIGTFIDGKPMTQEQLTLKLDELEPGKEHSEKQIGYIERGQRKISLNYARLLSQVFNVDSAYLLCESDFKTPEEKETAEESKFHAAFARRLKRDELVDDLIAAHGYTLRAIDKPSTDENGREYLETMIEIKSRSGACRFMRLEEYHDFRNSINNIVEGLLLVEFNKVEGRKNG